MSSVSQSSESKSVDPQRVLQAFSSKRAETVLKVAAVVALILIVVAAVGLGTHYLLPLLPAGALAHSIQSTAYMGSTAASLGLAIVILTATLTILYIRHRKAKSQQMAQINLLGTNQHAQTEQKEKLNKAIKAKEQLKAEVEQQKEQLKKKEKELEEAKSKLEKSKAESGHEKQNLEKQNALLLETLDETQNDTQNLQVMIENLRNQIEQHKEKYSEAVEKLNTYIENLKEQLKKETSKAKRLNEELGRRQKEIYEAEARLEDIKNKTYLELKQKLEEASTEIKSLTKQLEEVSGERDRLKAENERRNEKRKSSMATPTPSMPQNPLPNIHQKKPTKLTYNDLLELDDIIAEYSEEDLKKSLLESTFDASKEDYTPKQLDACHQLAEVQAKLIQEEAAKQIEQRNQSTSPKEMKEAEETTIAQWAWNSIGLNTIAKRLKTVLSPAANSASTEGTDLSASTFDPEGAQEYEEELMRKQAESLALAESVAEMPESEESAPLIASHESEEEGKGEAQPIPVAPPPPAVSSLNKVLEYAKKSGLKKTSGEQKEKEKPSSSTQASSKAVPTQIANARAAALEKIANFDLSNLKKTNSTGEKKTVKLEEKNDITSQLLDKTLQNTALSLEIAKQQVQNSNLGASEQDWNALTTSQMNIHSQPADTITTTQTQPASQPIPPPLPPRKAPSEENQASTKAYAQGDDLASCILALGKKFRGE